MGKKLISYFSATGVTKNVAERMAKVLNGDLFQIEPVELYTSDDLDWTDDSSRSSIEMRDKNYRPPIKNKVSNINGYDTVIIGFPVWWYTAPTIINTFIEENNLEGKSIYIFVTSGSSSDEGSFNSLKSTYPNLNFIKSKRFTSNVSDDEILDFIK